MVPQLVTNAPTKVIWLHRWTRNSTAYIERMVLAHSSSHAKDLEFIRRCYRAPEPTLEVTASPGEWPGFRFKHRDLDY